MVRITMIGENRYELEVKFRVDDVLSWKTGKDTLEWAIVDAMCLDALGHLTENYGIQAGGDWVDYMKGGISIEGTGEDAYFIGLVSVVNEEQG